MNQIVGLVLIGMGFAAPILTWRLLDAKNSKDGFEGFLTFMAMVGGLIIGFFGLGMAVGG